MLTSWLTLFVADENFAAALIFGLAGLDGSFWLISKPALAQIAEVLMVKVVEAELRKRRIAPTHAPPLILKRAGGRIVVPGVHVGRLGGGHQGRGRRFLYAVISAIRGKRMGLGKPESGSPLTGSWPRVRTTKPH